MNKTVTALGLLLAASNAAALPLVDFWVGGYSWATDYSGDVSALNNSLDLESNLGLDDNNNNVVWAAFEHPIPLVPNVQIKHTQMEISGTGAFEQNFTFGGQNYSADATLNSDLDLTHTDFTLYYGLPIPIATIDFGLNVRKFDGDLIIASDGVNASPVVLDAPVPMLFGRVGAELPFTGLAIMAEANYIGYKDTSLLDYQAVIRYTIPAIPVVDFNIEAGYRSFNLDIDPDDFGGSSDDLMADVDMSGVFLGLSFHL